MDRLRLWLNRYWLDVSLGGLSVLFGLVSLVYPFGRDQGLYYYVAREWVQHGAVPYRDVLDHKTPGIYLLYALAVRVFGANMWGIRVFDLFAVCGVSMVAATFSALPGEAPRPGVRGGTWLVTSVGGRATRLSACPRRAASCTGRARRSATRRARAALR